MKDKIVKELMMILLKSTIDEPITFRVSNGEITIDAGSILFVVKYSDTETIKDIVDTYKKNRSILKTIEKIVYEIRK